MVLAGNLVPAGTTLVTSDVKDAIGTEQNVKL